MAEAPSSEAQTAALRPDPRLDTEVSSQSQPTLSRDESVESTSTRHTTHPPRPASAPLSPPPPSTPSISAPRTQPLLPRPRPRTIPSQTPNQTWVNGTGPESALRACGEFDRDQPISFLEGQRASACTCPGEDHPGPSVDVGRSAPEIDVFETQTLAGHGWASQSLQIAPFDANYSWSQSPGDATLHSPETSFNNYTGGRYQEAVSAVSRIPDSAYELSGGVPVKLGVQYDPSWTHDMGGITWFVDNQPTFTLSSTSLSPNPHTQIGQRLIPTKPMSLVLNLALSDGFQKVLWNEVAFPARMRVDYIKVYQRQGEERVGCDPDDHPTARYIERHREVYEDGLAEGQICVSSPNPHTLPGGVLILPGDEPR